MHALAAFFQQTYVIYGLSGAIVAWAVVSCWFAFRGARRVRRATDRALALLTAVEGATGFPSKYEELSSELARTPVVSKPWRALRDTLLTPTEPGRPVQATVPAGEFFEPMVLLRAAGLNPRYHTALPGFLVGAGLCFTFLGLTLTMMSASDVVAAGVSQAQRNAALQQLLELASFKFVTSLAGLACSIIYALLWKQRCLPLVDRAASGLVDRLEEIMPLLTPLAAQEEATALARKQLTQFEAFSTDLAAAIGGTLDKALDTRLGEHIGPLREAMDRLAARTAADNFAALEQMLSKFMEGLQGGASDKMNDVAIRLADLGDGLKGLEAGLREAATRMADGADAMARRMGEGAEAALSRITDQMAGLAETLRGVAVQTQSASADASRDMVSRIEQAAESFAAAARDVAGVLGQAAEGVRRTMESGAEASAARLSVQFETMVSALRDLAEASRRAGSDTLSAVGERIAAAANGFEEAAARVASALTQAGNDTGSTLGRGAEEAVSRIAAATEGMRTELQTMLAELRTSLGSAGDALRDSGQQGAAALTDGLGAAGQGLAEALKSAAAALREGGTAAGEKLEQAGSTFGERASSLARASGDVAVASTGLGKQVEALTKVASEGAQPLTKAAEDLRAAGEAARNGTKPLQGFAQTVTAAVEQIGGAAQRIAAAENGAQTLSQNLTTAAQRFELVDRSLAGVLSKLTDSLAGFQDQIAKFVEGTDSNLAKAATHLDSVVRDLSETLEAFDENRRKSAA